MASEADFAWAAGFFDGEGCIHIGRQRRKSWTNYQLVVRVCQKERAPLDKLADLTGAMFVRSYANGSGRMYWNWIITGPRAARFLEDILPYLVLKKSQAELALDFQERKEAQKLLPRKNLKTGRFLKIDQEQEDKDYHSMRSLKVS